MELGIWHEAIGEGDVGDVMCPNMSYLCISVQIICGDCINCLEVGIWAEPLQLEDGHQLHSNVTKEDAIAKGVFIEISLAVRHKNVK